MEGRVNWLRAVLSERYVVANYSMLPTLGPGERLLISRLAFRLRAPTRGELVLFEHPERPGIRSIKRLIGLPGEQIELNSGVLLIDGWEVTEPYRHTSGPNDERHRWRPGREEYLVLGDNRALSRDSRHFGPVPRKLLRGPAWARY